MLSPAIAHRHASNPGSEIYSVLDKLEQCRSTGGAFTFKLLWPDNGIRWRQTSNPATQRDVAGYCTNRGDVDVIN